MELTRYNKKRNFKKTAEPRGVLSSSRSGHHFFIQKHDASHLHFDFRLELNGVLKSWAIPKGPSVFPGVRRLAVEVEDHPVDYGDFEGVIPQGEYGGGTVMLWDRGTWKPEGDAVQALKKGKITFSLDGSRLKGLWTLVRSHGDQKGKNLWFLIKKSGGEPPKKEPVDRFKTSVLSDQNLTEISEGSRRWKNKSLSGKSEKKEEKLEPLEVRPQLATLVDTPPEGNDWLHEIKFDGYRIMTTIKNGRVRLFSRNGHDWTSKLETVAESIEKLNINDGILDGELIAPDKEGHSDFQALQNAFKENSQERMTYYIFDLLSFKKKDLTTLPLIERKEILAQIFKKNKSSNEQIKFSDYVTGHGDSLFKEAERLGLEGIIAKKIDGPYHEGRSSQWLKIKCQHRQEFIIVGYTKPQGLRQHFGALLLAAYNHKGKLQYVGRTGTGFSGNTLSSLKGRLERLSTKNIKDIYDPHGDIGSTKNIFWVRPKLVGEVKFAAWTNHKILRQAAFLGLRTDKSAAEVKLEQAQPLKKVTEKGSDSFDATETDQKSTNKKIDGITRGDKVLFSPDITKLELLEYLMSVKKWIWPHIQGRPLSVVRCPDGHEKTCFFQKHAPASKLRGDSNNHIIDVKTGDFIYLDDFQGMRTLAQLGVLEIHTWGSHIKTLEKPDQIVFDLDADSKVKWDKIIKAATRIRDRLKLLKLKSFVKTTGGKGLHVVVPIIPQGNWVEVKSFCKSFAAALEAEFPSEYTSNMSKKERKNKIFIDYLRNGRGATAVAAYSPRAKAHAPVSTPLTWAELEETHGADFYTIRNLPERLLKLKKDPWDGFFKIKQRIPKI